MLAAEAGECPGDGQEGKKDVRNIAEEELAGQRVGVDDVKVSTLKGESTSTFSMSSQLVMMPCSMGYLRVRIPRLL